MDRPENFGNVLIWNQKNHFRANGKVDRKPWLEWWYYKLVIPETRESFHFTYGVINPWDLDHTAPESHSFVRFGDASRSRSRILEKHFEIGEFESSYAETRTKIGNNLATDKVIRGSLTDESGLECSWDIAIERRWAFNAMSWSMKFLTLTNIAWYPAQADARCSGKIVCGSEVYEFEDIPCYQDRNWCTSTPAWWAWVVSNQFDNHPDTAFVMGGGKPTILKWIKFKEGVIIGLRHQGKVYSFRPQSAHRIKTRIKYGSWEVEAKNLRHKIQVSAGAPSSSFTDIEFATPTGDTFHDYATLTGEVLVRLFERRRKPGSLLFEWVLIEELISSCAGIEYGSPEQQEPF